MENLRQFGAHVGIHSVRQPKKFEIAKDSWLSSFIWLKIYRKLLYTVTAARELHIINWRLSNIPCIICTLSRVFLPDTYHEKTSRKLVLQSLSTKRTYQKSLKRKRRTFISRTGVLTAAMRVSSTLRIPGAKKV